MSVILNVAFVAEVSHRVFVIIILSMLVITHSLGQFKIIDASQLINGISGVLQKLLKCFNGTTISTFLPDLFAS